jgi:phytoene dehydrogenase-like protein
VTTSAYDVVVIGGGSNGLVAAARLAKAGRRVLLVERADAAGGKARLAEFAPGFRAAPLALDPGWLPERIARGLGMAPPAKVRTGASLAAAVEPGSFLHLPSDAARASESIRAHSPKDAEKWPAFTARLRALAQFLEALNQLPAPDIDSSSLGELLPLLGVGRKFRALGRGGMVELLRTLPLSVAELAEDELDFGPLRAAVATAGICDHPQGPRSGGTGFVLLHQLLGAPAGAIRGRVPWQDGPDAFTRAAEAAARKLGATIRTGAAVVRIDVGAHRTRGVVLENGETIAAPSVLSTSNAAHTLLDLVDPVWLDPEFLHAVRNIRHRGCTAFVLYALDALPEFPGLSNDALAGLVSLTPSVALLERAADAAKYGEIPPRPHVEISVPTLHWPSLAPQGRHVLVARVQSVPYRIRASGGASGADAPLGESLERSVTAAIASASPSFASRVLHRVVWTPMDLETRFALREGAVSHGELGLDQILFMRPVPGWGRHTTPIDGLYLGGAGSHPGPGILGGAGWLATEKWLSDSPDRATA